MALLGITFAFSSNWLEKWTLHSASDRMSAAYHIVSKVETF
jgi:hypothetical protein